MKKYISLSIILIAISIHALCKGELMGWVTIVAMSIIIPIQIECLIKENKP